MLWLLPLIPTAARRGSEARNRYSSTVDVVGARRFPPHARLQGCWFAPERWVAVEAKPVTQVPTASILPGAAHDHDAPPDATATTAVACTMRPPVDVPGLQHALASGAQCVAVVHAAAGAAIVIAGATPSRRRRSTTCAICLAAHHACAGECWPRWAAGGANSRTPAGHVGERAIRRTSRSQGALRRAHLGFAKQLRPSP